MVDVVFHVGAHKCATTSLQGGLARLAAERDDMVYVPPARLRRRGVGELPCEELHDLVRLVGRGPEAEVTLQGVVDGLCRLIDSHSDRDRIVLSDEYILGGMPGLSFSFYPNAHIAREAIEGVARRFRTSVFLQSRETASYLKSSHQFRVRLGLTFSYATLLERYDLDSISWDRLGETLFDGAPYDWRVLPIERLRDPKSVASVSRALDFVVPGWSPDATPLEAANVSNGPLTRAAFFVLNRSGRRLDPLEYDAIAAAVDAAESAVAAARTEAEANEPIRLALESVSIPLRPRVVNLIRTQFEEERSPPGSLQRLLTERFAADYETFVSRYAS